MEIYTSSFGIDQTLLQNFCLRAAQPTQVDIMEISSNQAKTHLTMRGSSGDQVKAV